MGRPAAFVLLALTCISIGCGASAKSHPPTPDPTPFSTPATDPGLQPPKVLSALPEGRLLIQVPAANVADHRVTYEIEGNSVYLLAPAQISISADKQFFFYAERSVDKSPVPDAIVVSRNNGADTVRLPATAPFFGPHWSSEGSDLVFESGGTIYLRNSASGKQREFAPPQGAHVASWLAHGTKLLLVTEGGGNGGTGRTPYIMDAGTGEARAVVLPAGGVVGPAAEFDSFSPDADYIGYPSGDFQHGWDLSIMEISTGRTCLLMAKAPSHQYPQGVGWTNDGYATYFTRYDPARGFTDQHQVDRKTCSDSAVAPTPQPATPTPLPIPTVRGFDSGYLRSPSGRYILFSRSHWAVQAIPPGVTIEKPLNEYTPSRGEAHMYVIDEKTGRVSTLLEEQAEFSPVAWIP